LTKVKLSRLGGMTGVQYFLEFNEIVLPWKKIAKFYPEDVTNSYRSIQRKKLPNYYQ
jgi:hypothetical protein